MRDHRRFLKAAAALLLTIPVITGPVLSPVSCLLPVDNNLYEAKAEESIVHISNYPELKAFAKKCHIDRWSDGKHVFLDKDIKIPDDEELTIASFGGLFDGNNHTISNITLKKAAANSGLFGIVLRKGRISSLNVQGRYKASGVVKHLGGVAGANYGTVENCSFDGTIKADSEIGGIVGRNMEGGTVVSCVSNGKITGESSCGGIAGYNDGVIRSCTNRADVDTTFKDKAITRDRLVDASEELVKGNGANDLKDLAGRMDIGGVVGLSDGEVYSSTNEGVIGYEHVGYNIGGVVGRSTGFVRGCTNEGTVYGHRDVGGIVGQQQPYLEMNFEEGDLAKINNEVAALGDKVDSMLTDVSGYSNQTTGRLLEISGLASGAKDDMHKVTDDLGNSADEMNDTLQKALDQGDVTVEDLHSYLNEILDSVDDLEENVEDASENAGLSDSDKESIRNSIANIRSNINQFDQIRNADSAQKASTSASVEQLKNEAAASVNEAQKIIDELEKSVVKEDKEIWNAKEELKKAISEREALQRTDVSPAQIRAFTQRVKEKASNLGNQVNKYSDYAGLLSSEKQKVMDSITQLKSSLDALESNSKKAEASWEALRQEIRGLVDQERQNVTDSKNVLAQLRRNVADTMQMSSSLASVLEDKLDDDQEELWDSVHELQDSIRGNEKIHKNMTKILDTMDVFNEQTGNLSKTLQADGEVLYGRLSSIIDAINDLATTTNSNLQSSIADMKDLQHRGDQIRKDVYDVIEKASDPDTYTDDRFEDISDQGVETATDGRTTDCVHTGVVDADTNVGGITGNMGYEMDLDMEKDYEETGSSTFDFILQSSCIVDKCINRGKVKAHRNSGGGIAGRMDLGLLTGCWAYGEVKARNDFCGGICGYSASKIRSSYAKLTLSGDRYVGGIAGYGKELSDCISVAFVEDAEQFVGQIAGAVEDINIEDIHGNYYYAKDSYGIDDVSYAGIAEGISYEHLAQRPGLSQSFLSPVLTFVKEDEDDEDKDVIIKRITCKYNKAVPAGDIPPVPKKKGFAASWSRTDFGSIKYDEVIKAKYKRINTLIAGSLKGATGKPMLFAEGSFRRDDSLIVKERVGSRPFEKAVYTVGVPDDGQDAHVFRYAPSKADRTVHIFVYGKGRGTGYVKTSTEGKYITFSAKGNRIRFGAIEYWDKLIPTVTAVIVVFAVIVLIVLVIRFKKGKFLIQRFVRFIKSMKQEKTQG